MNAKATARAIPAALKKAGVVAPTRGQMVSFCLACFDDVVAASGTLDKAKALFDAARAALRIELARAYKVIGKGAPWDEFKAELREGMVAKKISATLEEAGRLINNAIIALGITGNGKKSGGKKKGRKARTTTGEKHDVTNDAAQWNAAALLCIESYQSTETREDVLKMLAEIGACLTGDN